MSFGSRGHLDRHPAHFHQRAESDWRLAALLDRAKKSRRTRFLALVLSPQVHFRKPTPSPAAQPDDVESKKSPGNPRLFPVLLRGTFAFSEPRILLFASALAVLHPPDTSIRGQASSSLVPGGDPPHLSPEGIILALPGHCSYALRTEHSPFPVTRHCSCALRTAHLALSTEYAALGFPRHAVTIVRSSRDLRPFSWLVLRRMNGYHSTRE